MPKKEKIRLILRQLNGETDQKEQSAFSHWLLESPENLDLYIEIKNLWESPMTREFNFNETKARKQIKEATSKNNKKIYLWQYAQQIAAAIIMMMMIGTLFYHQLRKTPTNTTETETIKLITKTSGAGEQLRITLPDGSVVRLNAESSIIFPEKFAKNERMVTLSGEAFFDVSKDAEHPFVIQSNHITTTVLGTSFNIKAFEREHVTVTVVTGKVKVEKVNDDHVDKLLLLPNQQAIYNEKESHFRIEEVDACHYFAWTSGTIRFNNDPLDEVVKVLERWYNVKIQISDDTRSSIRINGSYTDKKLYSILEGLGYIYNLNYNYINDNTIVINSKSHKCNLPMKKS